MLSGRTTTSISAPSAAPVDLNAGKPTFGELAPLFGLALLALLPIAIGGATCIAKSAIGQFARLKNAIRSERNAVQPIGNESPKVDTAAA